MSSMYYNFSIILQVVMLSVVIQLSKEEYQNPDILMQGIDTHIVRVRIRPGCPEGYRMANGICRRIVRGPVMVKRSIQREENERSNQLFQRCPQGTKMVLGVCSTKNLDKLDKAIKQYETDTNQILDDSEEEIQNMPDDIVLSPSKRRKQCPEGFIYKQNNCHRLFVLTS